MALPPPPCGSGSSADAASAVVEARNDDDGQQTEACCCCFQTTSTGDDDTDTVRLGPTATVRTTDGAKAALWVTATRQTSKARKVNLMLEDCVVCVHESSS